MFLTECEGDSRNILGLLLNGVMYQINITYKVNISHFCFLIGSIAAKILKFALYVIQNFKFLLSFSNKIHLYKYNAMNNKPVKTVLVYVKTHQMRYIARGTK